MKTITIKDATKRKSELLLELTEIENILKNPVNIMDRVKTFQDCLDIKGITKEQFDKRIKGLDKDTVSYEKIKLSPKS